MRSAPQPANGLTMTQVSVGLHCHPVIKWLIASDRGVFQYIDAFINAKAGETVAVDFFWRATAPLSRDYAVDTALIDALNRLTWKEPSMPDEGRAPMTGWKPGGYVLGMDTE